MLEKDHPLDHNLVLPHLFQETLDLRTVERHGTDSPSFEGSQNIGAGELLLGWFGGGRLGGSGDVRGWVGFLAVNNPCPSLFDQIVKKCLLPCNKQIILFSGYFANPKAPVLHSVHSVFGAHRWGLGPLVKNHLHLFRRQTGIQHPGLFTHPKHCLPARKRDLLAIVDDLKQRNIGFISVSDNIDTTTAHGRLFFHLMASLSEYERDLIRDRCSAGKSQAIANGVTFGRPRIPIDINRVNDMILAGIPKTKIAKKLNLSYRCLTSRINEHREKNDVWRQMGRT